MYQMAFNQTLFTKAAGWRQVASGRSLMPKRIKSDSSFNQTPLHTDHSHKTSRKQASSYPSTAKVSGASAHAFKSSHSQKSSHNHKKIQAKSSKIDKSLQSIGFNSTLQHKYPDAVEFLQSSGVGGFLKQVKLQLSVQNGELMIPVEGSAMSWSKLKQRFEQDSSWNGKNIPTSWRFDSWGLQPISAGEWTQLTPTSKEPAHPGKWYFDFMTTTKGLNHSWIRLVDEEGNVFSVGMSGTIHPFAMFRGSVAKIYSPDYCDFWPEPSRQTRVAISEEEFNKAMTKLHQDQQDHNLYFNLLSRNCSVYASEVSAEVGVEIDNLEFVSQAFHRSLFERVKLSLPKPVLAVASAVYYVARAILGTMFNFFVMGAWYQDKEVGELEGKYKHRWKKQPRKPFRSIQSFFDGTNYKMRSTFMIAEWQNFVIRHRQKRLEKLDKLKDEAMKDIKPSDLEKFEKEWSELRHQIEFEKPPKLKPGETIFIGNAQKIKTSDLKHRVDEIRLKFTGQ